MPVKHAQTFFDGTADNTLAYINNGSGSLCGFDGSNDNNADAYVQLFDAATGSITLGTTAPKLSILVPAGDASNLDGAREWRPPTPLVFNTAMTYAVTTTPTGATAPGTALVLNWYFVPTNS